MTNVVFTEYLSSGSDLFSEWYHGDQEDKHSESGHHGLRVTQVLRSQEQSSDEHLNDVISAMSPPQDAQRFNLGSKILLLNQESLW